MVGINKGISFESYMKDKEELRKYYEGTTLSDIGKEAVKGLEEQRIVLVFTEGYCPDCTVTLPFIKRFAEENPLIKIYIFGIKEDEDNREFLNMAVGESRIPTLLSFDKDMNPIGAYVELPNKLKNIIAKASLEEKKSYVEKYRQGLYNNFIEEEVLDILIKDRG